MWKLRCCSRVPWDAQVSKPLFLLKKKKCSNFHFRHILLKHYKGKIYSCHCGAVFKGAQSLGFHKESHEINEEISCEVETAQSRMSKKYIFNFQICDRSFQTKGKFLYHWAKWHRRSHGTLSTRQKYLKRVENGELKEIPNDLGSDRSKNSFNCLYQYATFLYRRYRYQPFWNFYLWPLWIHFKLQRINLHAL